MDREANVNWFQRVLLVVAGLFFLLFAFSTATGYSPNAAIFGGILFAAAIFCFWLAADTY